jgi:hypothetical protein
VCGSALLWECGRRNWIVEGPFETPIPPAFYLARLSRAFFCSVLLRLHTFAAYEVGNRPLFGTAERVLSKPQSRLEEHRSLGIVIKLVHQFARDGSDIASFCMEGAYQHQAVAPSPRHGVDHLFATLCTEALGFTLFFLPVTLYLTWLSVPFAQQSVVSQEHSSAGAQPLG